MADLEKAIRGLECCVLRDPDDKQQCDDCPYRHPDGVITNSPCVNGLMGNALSLLKAQRPRLMTFEEANGMQWDYCYVEDEVMMDKMQRMMYGTHRIHCITWPSIASYKMSYGENGYGKRWRCWTQKPTDEQRRAVKWDE